jgi:hypothetical protein
VIFTFKFNPGEVELWLFKTLFHWYNEEEDQPSTYDGATIEVADGKIEKETLRYPPIIVDFGV